MFKKSRHANELPIPDAANLDNEATEIIRFWIAQGNANIAVNPITNPNATAGVLWGVLLADIARHAANALVQTGVADSSKGLINEMTTTFLNELDFKRDVTGKVLDN